MDEGHIAVVVNCSSLNNGFNTARSFTGRKALFITQFVLYVLQQCFCPSSWSSLTNEPFSSYTPRFASVTLAPNAHPATHLDLMHLIPFSVTPSLLPVERSNGRKPIAILRRELYVRHGTVYGCSADPTVMQIFNYQLPRFPHPTNLLADEFNQFAAFPDPSYTFPIFYSSFPVNSNASELSVAHNKSAEPLKPIANHSVLPANTKQRDAPALSASLQQVPARVALLFMTQADFLLHPDIWVEWLTDARRYSYALYLKRQGPYKGLSATAPFTPLYATFINAAHQKSSHQPLLHPSVVSSVSTRITSQFENLLHLFQWSKLFSHFTPNTTKSQDGFKEPNITKNIARQELVNTSASVLPEDTFTTLWGLEYRTRRDPHLFAVIKELNEGKLQPSINCTWGNLNPCEYELLRHGLVDPRNSGFIFISESTIPVKPFSVIYNAFMQRPTSRFYFSNLNLPLVRKHHQWVVLNRQHAQILVDYPEKWRCGAWLKHWYRWNILLPAYAAPDEYLPFYALSENLGMKRIWTQINDRKMLHDPYYFSNTVHERGDRQFQHTWVCWWLFEESIPSEPCNRIGSFTMRFGSPVKYYKINASEAATALLRPPHIWFARKFAKDCEVGLDSPPYAMSLKQWLLPNLRNYAYGPSE